MGISLHLPPSEPTITHLGLEISMHVVVHVHLLEAPKHLACQLLRLSKRERMAVAQIGLQITETTVLHRNKN